MAQALFGCPVFYNFERILLKLVYSVPDPNLNNKQFNTGEVVYLWKVVAKTDTYGQTGSNQRQSLWNE